MANHIKVMLHGQQLHLLREGDREMWEERVAREVEGGSRERWEGGEEM